MKLNMLLTHRALPNLHEHIAVQNWHIMVHMLEALGLSTTDVPGHPPAPDLSAFCDGAPQQLVIVHPGASREYKRWPMDRYVSLANALVDDTEVCFIKQGHDAEKALHPEVRLVQPTSLRDFIALMGRASLFIGNNSGPMNIASALGIPGIVFCGPSTPNWDPAWHADRFHLLRDTGLRCQPCDKWDHPVNRCQNPTSPMACMLKWSVDQVHELAVARLKKVN